MAYPGLENLAQMDQVFIKQQFEVFEILSGCEMNNKYALKDSRGQQFMMAREDTDCCTRQCCGPARAFEMGLFDNQEQEILHLSRPYKCSSCCCPCCLQTLEVSCPSTGATLGSIHQEWGFCTPMSGKFSVKNISDDTLLTIQGPCCAVGCGSDVVFKVLTDDGSSEVGEIVKVWRGWCAEALTDDENFKVTFPVDLEVQIKALLLGAAFLIDFLYFETQRNN
ncbi:phospholipid scramblase 1-like [Cherax quadricarinatus]|uniref:phospholipid scramblase 1-like n=1 Tax=Cherax quadricarinatus TaxID=27406 RepID=UPI002378E5D1|nr:phospholipid scramblase 1-like [Cherax quadricarinatus]